MRRRAAGAIPYGYGMETNPPAVSREQEHGDGQVLFGAALVLVGLAFLADQADWLRFSISARFWPFVLLFFGVARLIAPRRRPRRTAVWLLSIGMWGVISEFRWFGLSFATSWPLLVVAAGLNMVLKSLEPPCQRRAVRET